MSSRPERIDVEVAREYLQEGRALPIDARNGRSYEASEFALPGAVHVDSGTAGASIDEALSALPRELLWIVYCDEPAQAASAKVARRARELGLNDASVLEGGWDAWLDAGAPTERIARTPSGGEKAA